MGCRTPGGPHAPPRRGRGLLVAVAVVALVVGGGVGAAAGWFLRDDEAPEVSSAEADAAYACGVADRLPSEVDLESLGDLEQDPTWGLLHSIADLGAAASLVDPTYEPIRDSGTEIREATLFFDSTRVTQGLDALRTTCTDLGLTEGTS
ncbi:hypothetical protein [Georgenia sp. Z1491]|uniref:hypothetical protein n=1 Tax=Georgenia sp. Z1491 TaxID=3416707 RepID=UPI003CE946D9